VRPAFGTVIPSSFTQANFHHKAKYSTNNIYPNTKQDLPYFLVNNTSIADKSVKVARTFTAICTAQVSPALRFYASGRLTIACFQMSAFHQVAPCGARSAEDRSGRSAVTHSLPFPAASALTYCGRSFSKTR
jgi:hypothetical protein